jgi:two-component system sensor histidine kinase UhpB
MSLRFRLNLIIALICLVALLLGSVIITMNARQSVVEEISSSLILAQQLVGQEAHEGALSGLEKVRHLRVTVAGVEQNRELSQGLLLVGEVPQLFVQFVRPNLEQLSLWLEREDNRSAIQLMADPSDEIREAWREAKVFIALLLLLTFLISISVFVVIGRALRPVDEILLAFAEIEKGHYQQHLAAFNLPEFARIAAGFNRMSEMLAQAEAENRRLNKKALEVSERERHYLARELHDEMGQSLSAIKALSVSAKQNAAIDEASLSKISAICDHLFAVVRNRMRQLTPPLLREFGLRIALEELVEQWQGTSEVMLEMEGSFESFKELGAIHLYRIIQESLTNILKYSQAEQVWIGLKIVDEKEGRFIALSVKDDGVGFDPKQTEWGSGLAGIKERVESLGGHLSIETAAGEGVRLSALLPMGAVDE